MPAPVNSNVISQTGISALKLENAKNIMDGLAWMSMPIDKLAVHLGREIEDEDERKMLYEHLKQFMLVYFDIRDHVLSQFPELDPIGKGAEDYFQAQVKYQAAGFPPRQLSEKEIKSAEAAGVQAAIEIQSEKTKE